jgi:hypothetical protein
MAPACNAKAVYRRIDIDMPLMNLSTTGCDGLAQPGRRAAVDSSSALFLDQTMAEPAILDKCGT